MGTLTTVHTGKRLGLVTVGLGDAPSPFEVQIHGPISNPTVSGPGWRLQLGYTLAHDQWVTINTRRNTVLRNDGANLAGRLSRTSRLANARLAVGQTEITFTGTDATATSWCELRWRPAYYGF